MPIRRGLSLWRSLSAGDEDEAQQSHYTFIVYMRLYVSVRCSVYDISYLYILNTIFHIASCIVFNIIGFVV